MKRRYAIVTFLIISSLVGRSEATVLDFESSLPNGLTPMSTYFSGNPVPSAALISDKYSDLGIIFEKAVLVPLGLNHAPSGVNGIGGIDSNGNLDYGVPITIRFMHPQDASKAVTDFFSITTDLLGNSGNSISLSAYALDGSYIDSTSYTEGIGGHTLTLHDIGTFHSVVIDASYGTSGGIAIDLVTFGEVVPEPCTVLLLGLGGLAVRCKRRK